MSDSRKEEILEELERTGDYFQCHKGSVVREKVMCRGYYEANKNTSLLIALGQSLDREVFVDVVQIMRDKMNKIRNKRRQ